MNLKSYGREAFAWSVALAFSLGTGVLFRVHVRGLREARLAPGTIIVVNHKRDLDSITIPPLLYFSQGLLKPLVNLVFMTREDLYAPGFLSLYFALPRGVSRMLYPINLSPIMHALHAYPIRQLPERTLGQLLQEVRQQAGDLRLCEVLRSDLLGELEHHFQHPLRDLPLHQVLSWHHRRMLALPGNLKMLHPTLAPTMAALNSRSIQQMLKVFVDFLRQGKVLYMTPEGTFSSNGSLLPFRGALLRILRGVPDSPPVLPANITYDFMTTQRMDIFVTFGPALNGLKGLPRQRIERLACQAILSLSPITLSHLGSLYLTRRAQGGDLRVDPSVMATELRGQVRALAENGKDLAPYLLREDWLAQRLRGFLAFCQKRGYLRRLRRDLWLIQPERVLVAQGTGIAADPVSYSLNELLDLGVEL